VVDAIEQFLAAQSAGDAKALARLLHEGGDGLIPCAVGKDGKLARADATSTAAFFDVAADGRPLAAGDAAEAARVLVGLGARSLRAIRANCASREFSVATCAFDCATAGAEPRPMRASVILRYDDAASAFRIVHWHASAAGAAPARR